MKNKWLIFATMILSVACGGGGSSPTDDPTHGTIEIVSDEAYKPILDAEIDTFEAIYPYAHIRISYLPESKAFQKFLSDSVRLIVASRLLDNEEQDYFKSITIIPRTHKIATDAVALIIHPSLKDSNLTMQQLSKVWNGEIKSWNQLFKGTQNIPIKFILDDANGSNMKFLKKKLNADSTQTYMDNKFAVGGSEAVVDYVSKNKDCIGVIGVNWVSDAEDSTTIRFRKKVKLLALSQESKPQSVDDYYQPYQAYVAQGLYPLSRDLYIISRESRTGLGTGFLSFVASDRGQRIILKAGLVPATVPLRIVKIKKGQP